MWADVRFTEASRELLKTTCSAATADTEQHRGRPRSVVADSLSTDDVPELLQAGALDLHPKETLHSRSRLRGSSFPH